MPMYVGRNEPSEAVVAGTDSNDELVNLLVDAAGKLKVSAAISSGDVTVELQQIAGCLIGTPSGSGGEFDTAYDSGTTIECTNLPSYYNSLTDEDIIGIVQINDSQEVVETYLRDDVAISVAGNVISVAGASFSATDTFVVYTLVKKDEYGAGNVGDGTQRVTIADDDTNLSAIKTAIELLDDLQGALKSVDIDELITRITDSSGSEINPAEEDGNLADILTALTDGVSIPPATHRSPSDFTAAYTSNVTITLSGLPFTPSSEQIVYIKQVDETNDTSALWLNGINCTLEISGSVITITPNDGSTPFTSDDEYEVGINDQDKAYDATLDSFKTSEQSPATAWYTDAVELVSEEDLTGSFADLGAEIDTRGKNFLALYVTLDVNDSIQPLLKILFKHESGGSEEYESHVYQLKDEDNLQVIRLDVSNVAFVQLQAMVDTVGATAGTLTVYVSKAWLPSVVDDEPSGVYKEVTIANGEDTSDVLDVRGYKHFTFFMPSAWTAADIAFLTSPSSGGTLYDVNDEFDNRWVVSVAADKSYSAGSSLVEALKSVPFLALQSVDSADPDTDVSQGGDRVIGIWMER